MKKLLIILMVVAMTSFLFVGCLGVTPPVPDEDEEEPEPVLPLSTTPVIETIAEIFFYTSDTQYINEDDATDGILVTGYAPKYSEVNVYINDEVVGTSTAYGGDEEFTVYVAEDNLGADGAKTLYATATEMGFAESAPSTEYAFILDTAAPYIEKVAATAESEDVDAAGTVTVTFNEAIATEGDAGDWSVVDITDPSDTVVVDLPELTSDDKEVELAVSSYAVPAFGNIIVVTYKGAGSHVTDLAGNLASGSFGYCLLEEE